METLKNPTETKARKEHKCDFCNEAIRESTLYMKSTHVYDGDIYSWKTHKQCADLALRLNMYEDCDEGLTQDMFCETIHEVHDDLLISMFSKEDCEKYSDAIAQLKCVGFHYKLGYVIRHFAKLDKE